MQIHSIDVGGEEMVGDWIGTGSQTGKPKRRDAREQTSLIGNRRGEHPIEGTDAVGADNQHCGAELVAIAHLAAMEWADAQVGLEHGAGGGGRGGGMRCHAVCSKTS